MKTPSPSSNIAPGASTGFLETHVTPTVLQMRAGRWFRTFPPARGVRFRGGFLVYCGIVIIELG